MTKIFNEEGNIEQFKLDLIEFLNNPENNLKSQTNIILFDTVDLLMYASELMYNTSMLMKKDSWNDKSFFDAYTQSTREFFSRSNFKKHLLHVNNNK